MSCKPKTVYVLGAGFSKSYSSAGYPLMGEFLQRAKSGGKYSTNSALAKFIARYFGYAEYHDLEKVMSFLAMTPFDDVQARIEHRQELYEELLRVIKDTLAFSHLGNAGGHTQHAYECFAKHLTDTGNIVITFNYDLLLDTLLYQTGSWIGFDGYGADIPSAFQALPRPARQDQGDYTPPTDKRSKTLLLKLHGSINWGIPTANSGAPHTIYQDPYTCYHMGHFDHNKAIGAHPLQGTVSSKQTPLQINFSPFLIPPVLDKSALLELPTIRTIWNTAKGAISAAEKLVFIGYSLPTTDFATEFLLRQCLKTSAKKEVVVVAPKPMQNDVVDPCYIAMLKRYEELCGSDIKPVESDALSWLQQQDFVTRYSPPPN